MATPSTPDVVGFIGLGSMGAGMATNLHRHLSSPPAGTPSAAPALPLHLHNRTAAKATALATALTSCTTHDTPAALAAACTVILSSLAHDKALTRVLHEVEDTLGPGGLAGKVWVDTSTVHPDTTDAAAARVQALGGQYLACPVFGRPDAAAAAQLVVVAAGDPVAKARVLPLLQAIGRKVLDAGTVPRQGSALKLTGNFMIASSIEMLGEAMTLAEKSNIDRATFQELVGSFFGAAGPIAGYCNRIATDDFGAGTGFTVELGIKDVGHVRDLGAAVGAPVPLADLAFNHLLAARSNRMGHLDWGAMALSVRREAGLPVEVAAPAAPAAEPEAGAVAVGAEGVAAGPRSPSA